MGVCGCVIPSPDCHCHFTPVSDWQYNNSTNYYNGEIERLRQQNAELSELITLYREAVVIDVQMEGPQFMGSNRSALKRAWDKDCAIAKATGGE